MPTISPPPSPPAAPSWMVLSVAAVLPILWAFTLSLHFARPYVLRFLQSLTLRFGGDVWWLSYVLIRDALLVITLCLSVGVPVPQPVPAGRPADHGADRDARAVLGDARQADPRPGRRPGGLPPARASCSSSRRCCTSSRRSTAWRRPTRRTSATCPNALISTGNLELARPILWVSLALFGITGAAVFVRFLLRARPAGRRRGHPAAEGLAARREHSAAGRRRRLTPTAPLPIAPGVRPSAPCAAPMIRAMCEQFVARAAGRSGSTSCGRSPSGWSVRDRRVRLGRGWLEPDGGLDCHRTPRLPRRPRPRRARRHRDHERPRPPPAPVAPVHARPPRHPAVRRPAGRFAFSHNGDLRGVATARAVPRRGPDPRPGRQRGRRSAGSRSASFDRSRLDRLRRPGRPRDPRRGRHPAPLRGQRREPGVRVPSRQDRRRVDRPLLASIAPCSGSRPPAQRTGGSCVSRTTADASTRPGGAAARGS